MWSVFIVAGTSIGGINAAIIAGSIDKEHPERTLEEFWLELGKNSVNLTNPVMEWMYDKSRERLVHYAFASHLSICRQELGKVP
jgi:predicted acylesterase/phospholipase RssA